MSTVDPAPIDAPRPFSGETDSNNPGPAPDTILRSSDAVDFHCHKFLLAFSSAVFNDLFTFSPAGEPSKAGRVVVQLPESSDILYILLTYAYPATSTDSLQISNLAHAREVLTAADKYNMPGVESLVVSILENAPCASADAPALFVLGVARSNELMGKAAYLTLNDVVPTSVPIGPASSTIPSHEVLRVLQIFHRHCVAKAQYDEALVSDHLDDGPGYYVWWNDEGHAPGCGAVWEPPVEGYGQVLPAQWFRNHMARVATDVAARPNGRTAERLARIVGPAEQTLIDACPLCSKNAKGQLRRYAARLGALIDQTNFEETNRMWQCGLLAPPVDAEEQNV
ncbi:hypothetical protein C8R46DRAFT_1125545 [Mycena filopes]|nr:hypothetical protein C8R46DRAFT_1125545 [Mycena filopes]